MWYKTLELHTTRCFEQYDRVALQPGLKLRPEIFDIGRRDHALALLVLLERGRELADARDDVRSRCQRETSDIGVTLFRRRTELPHRTKDDYPLPSATRPLQELDRGTG